MRTPFLAVLIALALPVISRGQTSMDTAAGTPGGVSSGVVDNGPTLPDVPAEPPHKTVLSREEARRIAQQEVLRQQELIYKANRAVIDARNAELGGDYIKANVYYATAVEAYGAGGQSSLSRRRAAEGLTRVNLILAQDALNAGNVKRAKSLLEEALVYDPADPELNIRLNKIKVALADPNSTEVLGNPAITPEFVKNVNEVQALFAEAEQFRRTGQWDESEARLKRILGIDPYNIGATRKLEQINDEKTVYAEKARLETREEMLRKLEELWYDPVRNPEVSVIAQDSQPVLERSETYAIDEKLKSIKLTMDFDNFTIDQALNYLTSESKRLDPSPDRRGVPFVIQPTVDATAKKVTLNLDVPLPLGDALRYICAIAGVKYKVEDSYVLIVPYSSGPLDLVKKTFIVPPNFFSSSAGGGDLAGGGATPALGAADEGAAGRPAFVLPTTASDTNNGGPQTIQQILESKGIQFPPGASAVYSPTTQELEVTDTPDQMEFLEEVVTAGVAPVYMVKVSTKFVEINQQDLDDLTINTVVNGFSSGVSQAEDALTGRPVVGPQFGTSLPGVNGLPQNGIDTLLNGTPFVSPTVSGSFAQTGENGFTIHGFLGAQELNIYLQALSQKKSYDLLTEPTTLVKNSESATLNADRVFPYPVTFEPPQTVTPTVNNNQQGAGGAIVVVLAPPAVIPTTPTEFKTRAVGVTLVARPQISPNDQDVDLTLLPTVTDFLGFVNYGSPINAIDEAGHTSLLTENVMNQPVFNVRTINTRVLIHDGSTLVLGGLIREDIQSINDKVPILGDMPFFGRLFQSKTSRKTKRNLLVFVTTTIYRNNGERLNPPDQITAADVLTGRATTGATAQ